MLRLAFWLLVALPTTAAAVFYGLIAGPRYESEARFIVRSVASQQTTGFDAVFRTFGLAKTVDDAYVIQKYLLSRDALDGLAQQGPDPRTVFSRPEIDRLSRYPRFWREASNESLYDFYLDHVDVTEDDVKGIVRIRVVAFRPDDAQAVVVSLLHLAEAMVNRMNERAQSDSLNFARSEVKRAEANVITAQQELAAYRNKELIVDPSKSATSMIETIGGLSGDLARANAQLKETQAMSPRSPSIPSIKARIAALDERIGIERQRLAGGDTSLANKLGEYERRVLARDLADRGLTNALESLDTARQEAHRQHIYVEEVVQPTLPDESTEPKRLRSILTVFVLGFALFGVCWILVVGAGEHAQ
ncbi:MAG: capsule biosynthesis protein [Ancalomicrobiaceae bacterium]|nr:capsule biosynthesis protein [Ancalomicrobiaceae bacterium]